MAEEAGKNVGLPAARAGAQAQPNQPWLLASYAENWYEDCVLEARLSADEPAEKRNNLRREVVFAVCFVESYLFEEVRRLLLERDPTGTLSTSFAGLLELLPVGDRRGIRQRWKDTWRRMHEAGYLVNAPKFNTSVWNDFMEIVEYRDGFVHASASRPQTHGQPEEEKPVPSPEDLDGEECGFAANTVYELVRQLQDDWPDPDLRMFWLETP